MQRVVVLDEQFDVQPGRSLQDFLEQQWCNDWEDEQLKRAQDQALETPEQNIGAALPAAPTNQRYFTTPRSALVS